MNEFQVLDFPHLSEKCITLHEKQNTVAFRVHPDSNKIQIKEAVEKIFKVTVLSVNTINCQGKMKRRGNFVGRQASWKKALVTLKKGDSISYFEGA